MVVASRGVSHTPWAAACGAGGIRASHRRTVTLRRCPIPGARVSRSVRSLGNRAYDRGQERGSYEMPPTSLVLNGCEHASPRPEAARSLFVSSIFRLPFRMRPACTHGSGVSSSDRSVQHVLKHLGQLRGRRSRRGVRLREKRRHVKCIACSFQAIYTHDNCVRSGSFKRDAIEGKHERGDNVGSLR